MNKSETRTPFRALIFLCGIKWEWKCFRKTGRERLILSGTGKNRNTGNRKRYAGKDGKRKMIVKRGDVFYADLSPVVGSEQGGLRPVLIIQNDVGNRYSPTVIAAAITSRLDKADLPTHIGVTAMREEGANGLTKDSVILLEQIRTIDKRRLREKLGHMEDGVMRRVDEAISVSFGLGDRRANGPVHGGYIG